MILAARERLGGRFRRLEDLLAIPGGIISASDLERLRPFVTLRAWVDGATVSPAPGMKRPAPGTWVRERIDPGPLVPERRAPINVNTAPAEVLTALIAGLAGSRIYNPPTTEVYTQMRLKARGKIVREGPIEFEKAQKVAEAIVACRRSPEPDPDRGSRRSRVRSALEASSNASSARWSGA